MDWLIFKLQPRISIKKLQAIIFDFDGVFTDNRVLVTQEGQEAVLCNRADGLGIRRLQAQNMPLLIISTESNPVVAARAAKLGVAVRQGVADKKLALCAYCREMEIDRQRVMYIGNDLNDYEVMQMVGYPVAPEDAHPVIRRIARYLIRKKGGEGVVKALSELLITE